MDVGLVAKVFGDLVEEAWTFVEGVREASSDANLPQYRRLSSVLHGCAPILTAVVFYHYLKYLLVFDACRYEEFVKKRWGYLRKLSKQLRRLTDLYGKLYFCYMPMNHGTALPPTRSLFVAIKEVLTSSDRPASRGVRAKLLMDLLHGDHRENYDLRHVDLTRERDPIELGRAEADPLSEYNLDIMKCSRELIIQGIKDFDVMTTVYRVMETATEDVED